MRHNILVCYQGLNHFFSKDAQTDPDQDPEFLVFKQGMLSNCTKCIISTVDLYSIQSSIVSNFIYIYVVCIVLIALLFMCSFRQKHDFTQTHIFSEQNAVPIIQVENLKTDLKAGVDDLKHPEDIDNDALKMVMDYRARRDQIEDNVKQEEINIVDLSRELCQAKVQRKTQKGLHEEAIQKAQDFSVSSLPLFF